MQLYDVYETRTRTLVGTLDAATIEDLYQISVEDLEWAIEEDSVCTWNSDDGVEMLATPAGDEVHWG